MWRETLIFYTYEQADSKISWLLVLTIILENANIDKMVEHCISENVLHLLFMYTNLYCIEIGRWKMIDAILQLV